MERKYYRHHFNKRRRAPDLGGDRRIDGEMFVCRHCGVGVPLRAAGTTQRNHCPHCLRSLHVDIAVGDRRSLCGGVMDPVGLWVRANGEVALIHRCNRCGVLKGNRVAGDDNEQELRRLAEQAAGAFPAV